MTIKQQIDHSTIQKVSYLHNGIFHPFHLCHKLSIFVTSLELFTKHNKLWIERKEDFFVYMAASAYHVISKDVENRIFRKNCIFRRTCMYNVCHFSSPFLSTPSLFSSDILVDWHLTILLINNTEILKIWLICVIASYCIQ